MVETIGVLVACHNLRYPPKQNQPQQTVYDWQTPHPIPFGRNNSNWISFDKYFTIEVDCEYFFIIQIIC